MIRSSELWRPPEASVNDLSSGGMLVYLFNPRTEAPRYKYYISGGNVVTDDYEVAADKAARDARELGGRERSSSRKGERLSTTSSALARLLATYLKDPFGHWVTALLVLEKQQSPNGPIPPPLFFA